MTLDTNPWARKFHQMVRDLGQLSLGEEQTGSREVTCRMGQGLLPLLTNGRIPYLVACIRTPGSMHGP